MITPQTHIERLRKRLDANPRQVVAVLGTGVSIALAPQSRNILSWVGLLKHGTTHYRGPKKAPIEALWTAYDNCPPAGRTSLLITIAQRLVGAFGGQESSEFGNWINKLFSGVRPDNNEEELVQALIDTECILLTTNYDTLVEQISGYPSVAIEDRTRVERVLSGDEKGIIHLHGVWTDPARIILDLDSYLRAQEDRFLQLVMDDSSTGRNLLFVGFGGGVDDPNFSTWIERIFQMFPHTEYDKYILVTEEHANIPENFISLCYGSKGEYQKLPGFIRGLKPEDSPARQLRRLPYVSGYFGRDTETRRLVSCLTETNNSRIIIYGPVGIGKGTTALKTLQNPAVIDRFRARRFLIHCHKVSDCADFLYTLAYVVDVPGSRNLSEMGDAVLLELEQAPAVLFLDNLESLLEIVDWPEIKNFVTRLAVTPNVALLIAYRGNSLPFSEFEWTYQCRLQPIAAPYDREIFLRAAGSRFANHPLLSPLLGEMQGIPLAIKLVARLATAETSLDDLLVQWKEHKTDLLRTGSGAERDESWTVSLGLTLANRRMQRAERTLLSCLAFFPDGMSRTFLEHALPLMHPALNTLVDLGLVEETEGNWLWLLAPIREHVNRRHPPVCEEISVLTDKIISFAKVNCSKIGGTNGLVAVHRIRPIVANIEAAIRFGLAGPDWAIAATAAQKFTAAVTLACIGDQRVLDEAYEKAKQEAFSDPTTKNHLVVAKLRRAQAKAAEQRGDINEAETLYQGLESHFIPTLTGLERAQLEARVRKDLADIALTKRQPNATTLYAQARHLLSKPGVGFPWHPIACDVGQAAATLVDCEILGETKEARKNKTQEVRAKLETILATKTLKLSDDDSGLRRIRGKCYQLLSGAAMVLNARHPALRHLIKALVEFGPTGDIRNCSDCILRLINLVAESKNKELFFQDYISNRELMSRSSLAWKARVLSFGHLHMRLGAELKTYKDEESAFAAKFHYLAAKEFGKRASAASLVVRAEEALATFLF